MILKQKEHMFLSSFHIKSNKYVSHRPQTNDHVPNIQSILERNEISSERHLYHCLQKNGYYLNDLLLIHNPIENYLHSKFHFFAGQQFLANSDRLIDKITDKEPFHCMKRTFYTQHVKMQ